MTKRYFVIGAGSIGISTALHLQQRGLQVCLIDRDPPASATSYGNAGIVNNCSFYPVNNPSLWKKIPQLLTNRRPELRYNARYLISYSGWLAAFLRSSGSAKTRHAASALASLLSGAPDEHKALMQRVGNMHRLNESGWLRLYRQKPKQFFSDLEHDLYHTHEIAIESLNKEEIRDLEPNLNPIFESGYLLKDSMSVNNPGMLLKEYFQHFLNSGGEFSQSSVTSIARTTDGFKLKTEGTTFDANVLVVCLGVWSGQLLKTLGYRVNLGTERGYHQHFHILPDGRLTRPIYDMSAGYILAPMEQGLRLTTGVELNHWEAQPSYAQLEQVIPRAREALNLGSPTDDPIWMGCRPTFPDSVPVIDNAPNDSNLWLAFGHQHIGLMSGPVTGKLMVQKMMGEDPDIDLSPFRSDRWIKQGRG